MKAIIIALATATLLVGAANAAPRGKVNNTGHTGPVYGSAADSNILATGNAGSQNKGSR